MFERASRIPRKPRIITRLSKRESDTLVALDRSALTYRQMAAVATRLFGRSIAASTVQQHLKFRALKEERELACG
jgi:hypothetical protein